MQARSFSTVTRVLLERELAKHEARHDFGRPASSPFHYDPVDRHVHRTRHDPSRSPGGGGQPPCRSRPHWRLCCGAGRGHSRSLRGRQSTRTLRSPACAGTGFRSRSRLPRCLGVLGGSGSNAAGYSCRGTFVLDGQRYSDTIPGDTLLAPGTTVRLVTVESDPGLIATIQQVESDHTSWAGVHSPDRAPGRTGGSRGRHRRPEPQRLGDRQLSSAPLESGLPGRPPLLPGPRRGRVALVRSRTGRH